MNQFDNDSVKKNNLKNEPSIFFLTKAEKRRDSILKYRGIAIAIPQYSVLLLPHKSVTAQWFLPHCQHTLQHLTSSTYPESC